MGGNSDIVVSLTGCESFIRSSQELIWATTSSKPKLIKLEEIHALNAEYAKLKPRSKAYVDTVSWTGYPTVASSLQVL